MYQQKIRIGVIFGGKSAEHEVSLQSAKNIIEALDKDKYEPLLICIDKQGQWSLADNLNYLENEQNPELIKLNQSGDEVTIIPRENSNQIIKLKDKQSVGRIDVAFPMLHGTYGEDGSVQGLLRMLNIPFVGADVLGSAVGMDKDIMKRLFRDSGIPIGGFLVYHKHELPDIDYEKVKDELSDILFIKPANLGSSVGINKATTKAEFEFAVEEAFKYDTKIIIEEFIKGREIECAVLGNENPEASIPGEIVPRSDFYSYKAKYIDEKGAILKIPAELSEIVVKKIQQTAVQSFKTLCCEGMARVDLFLTPDNEIFVNEINTIPGFTQISMYPKLWEISGIPYKKLIDKLIEFAIKRHSQRNNLSTNIEL